MMKEEIEKLRSCIHSAKEMNPEEFEETKNVMKIKFTELMKNYNRNMHLLHPEMHESVNQLYALVMDFYTMMGGTIEKDFPEPDVAEMTDILPKSFVPPSLADFNKMLFTEANKGNCLIRDIVYFYVTNVPRMFPSSGEGKPNVTKANVTVFVDNYAKKYFNGCNGTIVIFERTEEAKETLKPALICKHLYTAASCRVAINDPINPNAKYIPIGIEWQIAIGIANIVDLGPCIIRDTK